MMPFEITVFNTSIPLYYVGYVLSFPACVVFNVSYYRKCYALGNIKMIFITMLGVNMAYIAMLLASFMMSGMVVHGFNWIRVVGFMPLFWFPLALLSKTKFTTVVDFMTPSAGIANIFVHTGCIFAGCCNGYPIENYPSWMQWMGIYNNPKQAYLFPIQLVEVAIILVLVIVIVLWSKHKKFQTQGRAYPIYLIMFCVTRFFCEFLRDNKKYFWNLSEFSFWCVAWTIVGVVWLVVQNVLEKRKVVENIQEPPDEEAIEGSIGDVS